MTKKRKIYLLLILAGLLVIGSLLAPGQLVLERSSLDTSQEEVVIKRGDQLIKTSALPAKTWLRPGRYTVGVTDKVIAEVTIRPLKIATLVLNTQDIKPEPKTVATPFGLQLPHLDDGFSVFGQYTSDDNKQNLIGLEIVLYPQLASTESQALQEEEIKLLTGAAKKYLADQNVPPDLPLTFRK